MKITLAHAQLRVWIEETGPAHKTDANFSTVETYVDTNLVQLVRCPTARFKTGPNSHRLDDSYMLTEIGADKHEKVSFSHVCQPALFELQRLEHCVHTMDCGTHL
jgi:hypothetical protein